MPGSGVVPLLLAWYRATGRALPWRATTDPWSVLVSEVMLQQTQVSRVVPAWHAFLARFPAPADLAAAPLAEVLRAWAGLGYNRRARALWETARALVARHGGTVPDDLDALRALPGIGGYTARAVRTFAFGRPEGPVDVNVARVLSRAVAGAPLRRAEVQALADRLAAQAGRDATAWNHGLMDLGATVCTARAPRCPACPLAGACAWHGPGGSHGEDPAATSAVRARPQAAFATSDRRARGSLVAALRTGPLGASELQHAAGLPPGERLSRVVGGLVDDGLAAWRDDLLVLPDGEGWSRGPEGTTTP